MSVFLLPVQAIPPEVMDHMEKAFMIALGLDGIPANSLSPAMLADFIGDEYEDEIEKLFGHLKTPGMCGGVTPQVCHDHHHNTSLNHHQPLCRH